MGFTKAGGLGGAQLPPFASTRIRATFPNSKHGDDMMLVLYCTRMGCKKRGGKGGEQHPQLQTRNDPRNLPLLHTW